MSFAILFTHLKIILLQCFQFSATISSIQTHPICNKHKSEKAMKKLIKIFLHQVHGIAHVIERVRGWDEKLYFSWMFK